MSFYTNTIIRNLEMCKNYNNFDKFKNIGILQAMRQNCNRNCIRRSSRHFYLRYKEHFLSFNPLDTELNPICQSQHAELFCGYLNFAHAFEKPN